VSTDLINRDSPDDIASGYYNAIWENQEKRESGYVKPDEFWELPLWIAELSYCLQGEKELCIIQDEKQVLPDADYYFFSVLDVNKQIISQIIHDNPKKHFIIGGYANMTDLWYDYSNIDYFQSIRVCVETLGFDYEYGLDYSLFAGTPCIPRLTLSTGCKHKCKFCTVPDKVCEYSSFDILRQVDAMKVLNFKLIYVNDKTFGQCKNYRNLKFIYNTVKRYNPNFDGFIIQTTCNQVLKFRENDIDLCGLGVRVVEIGVESYNDDILKYYNKPQNQKAIDLAVNALGNQGLKIIPNIIIGLLYENFASYANTIKWLFENRNLFYMLNVYNYAVYVDSDINDYDRKYSPDDTNELKTEKSFHTKSESFAAKHASDTIFSIGLEIIKGVK
jgi:hypothetical protein